MKNIKTTLLALASIALLAPAFARAECSNPVGAVEGLLNCIEREWPICAARGYARSFKKLHNTVDTETPRPNAFFWWGAFLFVDFKLDVDHIALVDDNQVSVRYVETVKFRDGDEFLQHEHALVTLDNNCRLTLWDQYGDNQEQAVVDEKMKSLFPF